MKKVKHKKSLGQNFLHDKKVIEDIVRLSEIKKDDTVVEIGPGEGVLTEELIKTGAEVFAIEIDKDLIENLEERFRYNDNCTIINDDVRSFNLPIFLQEQNVDKYKVVANLPYYITSLIIRLFLESVTQPSEMIIMVQKEVAERICAKPGSMSVLAVSVQFYGVPEYLFTVNASSFEPMPKVDSAVIKIKNINRTFEEIQEKKFFRIVRVGFSSKRKKLINNLSGGLHIDKQILEETIKSLNFDKNIRAQELSINNWKELYFILNKFL